MKSILRLGMLLLIVMMAFGGVVHAQENTYGLDDADWKLLNGQFASDKLLKMIGGFQMAYKVALKGSTTGDNPQNFDVKVDGTGGLGLDMAAMQSGGGSDPSAMLGALLFSNVINGDINGGGQAMKGTLELRVVGGNLYFNLGAMSGNKWQFVKLGDLAANLSKMGSGSGNPLSAATGAASDPAVAEGLGKALQAEGVITAEAVDGPEIDGVATRQITFKLNVEKLITDPNFAPVIKEIAKSQGGAGGAAPSDEVIAAASKLLAQAFKDSNLSIYWQIGKEDGVARGFGIDVAVKVDEATAAMLNTKGTFDISFNFNVEVSKLGTPIKVEAPADATEMKMGG